MLRVTSNLPFKPRLAAATDSGSFFIDPLFLFSCVLTVATCKPKAFPYSLEQKPEPTRPGSASSTDLKELGKHLFSQLR